MEWRNGTVGKANTGSLLKSVVVSKGEKHKGLKKTSLIVNHRSMCQRKSEEKLAVKTKQNKQNPHSSLELSG